MVVGRADCLLERTKMARESTNISLATKDLYVISRDIREHGSRSYGAEAYGDECDLITWMNFLEAVETEYKSRPDKTVPIP